MKYNKLKAFTLAEVMVLLLTLTILLAAFAPIFTRRYVNTANDDVWTYVPRGNLPADTKDIYYDSVDRNYKAQAFIGLTPKDATDVNAKTTYLPSGTYTERAAHPLSSKLVIAAAGERINGTLQNQIQFRAGTNNGSVLGSLFAGNGNMLVGGPYKNIESSANGNTAYGSGALQSLTKGYFNTAVGKQALSLLNEGYSNTAIGMYVGWHFKKYQAENVLVGYSAGSGSPMRAISDGTFIGYLSGSYDDKANYLAEQNTAIGYKALYKNPNGNTRKNTVVGDEAFSESKGAGNVALGNKALYKSYGDFNTAVGAYAGYRNDNTKETKYKTFIGYNSGNGIANDLLFGDSKDIERVFIGTSPKERVGATGVAPGAVLEVHNVLSKQSNSKPIPNVGNSSVVINGNLIVRGNTYLEAPILRQASLTEFYKHSNKSNDSITKYVPKGLVLFRLSKYKIKINNESSETKSIYAFNGYDGFKRDSASYEWCNNSYQHKFNDIRKNCICTAVRTTDRTSYSNGYDLVYTGNNIVNKMKSIELPVSDSYDWFSKTLYKYSVHNKTNYDAFLNYQYKEPSNGVINPDYDMYFNYDGVEDTTDLGLDRCMDSEVYLGTANGPNQALDDDNSSRWDSSDGTRRQIGCTAYADLGVGEGTLEPLPLKSDYKYYSNTIKLTRRASAWSNKNNDVYKETDYSYAHLNFPDIKYGNNRFNGVNYYDSCCPVLIDEQYKDSELKASDKRLKNVGEQFTAGLDEIKKLNVYNYTFKNDKNKIPQVGVIAQDLRLIFPNAVTQDEKGYYKIRWDEMFYAAINAIKTLNAKIESFIVKVDNDKQRIAQLKKDNNEMNNKLDELSKELTRLEKLAARKNNK